MIPTWVQIDWGHSSASADRNQLKKSHNWAQSKQLSFTQQKILQTWLTRTKGLISPWSSSIHLSSLSRLFSRVLPGNHVVACHLLIPQQIKSIKSMKKALRCPAHRFTVNTQAFCCSLVWLCVAEKKLLSVVGLGFGNWTRTEGLSPKGRGHWFHLRFNETSKFRWIQKMSETFCFLTADKTNSKSVSFSI